MRYSFAALEAWARERGQPRGDEQTPLEFAQQLTEREPRLAREALSVADLYCQLAYAGGKLPATAVTELQRLWQLLRATS
ncbi:MAG: DUF4129 domain-containing protein [Planctomycetota bacterium]